MFLSSPLELDVGDTYVLATPTYSLGRLEDFDPPEDMNLFKPRSL